MNTAYYNYRKKNRPVQKINQPVIQLGLAESCQAPENFVCKYIRDFCQEHIKEKYNNGLYDRGIDGVKEICQLFFHKKRVKSWELTIIESISFKLIFSIDEILRSV